MPNKLKFGWNSPCTSPLQQIILKLNYSCAHFSCTTTPFTSGRDRSAHRAATQSQQFTANSTDIRYTFHCHCLLSTSPIRTAITSPRYSTISLSDSWNPLRIWPTSWIRPEFTCCEQPLWSQQRRRRSVSTCTQPSAVQLTSVCADCN